MYRVLIVDDEARIRRGIKNSVNWNELDIEMVAEASNGVEALAQVLENQPDIILLDINMPRMDGLEFASIIKKQYPKTKIIIITGYQDFEFAQTALRLGVEDYIIKPVTKDIVSGLIQAQLEKIKEEQDEPSNLFALYERQEKHAILNGLLRKTPRAEEDIARFLYLTGLPDSTYRYALLRDHLSQCELWDESETDDLAQFAMLNIADELLEQAKAGIAFETYKNEMAVLVRDTADAEPLLRNIKRSISSFLSIPVNIAASAPGSLRDLPSLEEQAVHALGGAFLLSDAEIVFFDRMEKKQPGSFTYPKNLEMELFDKMFVNDLAESISLINELFQRFSTESQDMQQCRNMLLRLFMKMHATIESLLMRIGMKPNVYRPKLFDPLEKMESFNSLDAAREWFAEVYTDTYEYIKQMQTRTGQLYHNIVSYIQKNYMNSDLNLKKCSEDLYLSPNYVSMILKKETGKAFVDYLNEFRIDLAKDLLQQPDSKVYEVAAQVGFAHPTYFSSVFKKLTGTTPKKYYEENRR